VTNTVQLMRVLVCGGLLFSNFAQVLAQRVENRLRWLTHNSGFVVHAILTAKHAEISTDNSSIVTILEFNVKQSLIGMGSSNDFRVEIAGGQIGRKAQFVTHQPKYQIGDEMILFLKRFPTRNSEVYGVIPGGKFNIENRNNREWIYNDTGDAFSTSEEKRERSIDLPTAIRIVKSLGHK
jgi:hypothetical protein